MTLLRELYDYLAKELPRDLSKLLRHFDRNDLRWSWVIIFAMVPIGIIINLFFAHGWTVWPCVAMVGFLVMINEAVDRSGQGFPPLQIYAFFFCALVAYAIFLVVMSSVNGFVLLLGAAGLVYYSGKSYMTQREQKKLITQRQADGQCIYCGKTLDPQAAYCENCGQEPSTAARSRIGAVMNNSAAGQRMRGVIAKTTGGAIASRKEQALLARSSNRLRSTGKKR